MKKRTLFLITLSFSLLFAIYYQVNNKDTYYNEFI